MQLILIQSEIEQAIQDYVSARVAITDGHKIQIDLSATRGADGFKATIDIVPDTDAVSPVKTKAQPDPVKAEAADPAPRTLNVGKTVKAAPTPAEAQTDLEKVVVESSQEDGEGEGQEVEAGNDAEVAPAKERSLFAGLKKPVNPK